MKISYLLSFFIFFIRELDSKNPKFFQRLLLLIIISIFSSGNLSAQIEDITILPNQNTETVYEESSPVIISDNEILIFFFTRNNNPNAENNDTLYSARSMDRGKTWQEKKFMLAVSRPYSQNYFYITTIKTSSGRIILAFRDWGKRKLCIIHSDDNGISWSDPIYILGEENPPGTTYYSLFNLKLSEISNGRIRLSFNSNFVQPTQKTYFRESTDWGETWSDPVIFHTGLDRIKNLSFVDVQNNNLLAFFEYVSNDIIGIYKEISTDGGSTWSDKIKVTDLEFPESNPCLLKTADNKLWLLYQVNDTIFYPGMSDIYYMKSEDNGNSWSSPVRFTKYIGKDNYLNGCVINQLPFITFSTTRFTNNPLICYAIPGETIERFSPPYIINFLCFPDSAVQGNWLVNCKVVDDKLVHHVILMPENRTNVELFDDGKHNDRDSADNIFGAALVLDYTPPLKIVLMNANKLSLIINNKGNIVAPYDAEYSFNSELQASDNDNGITAIKEKITININPFNQYPNQFEEGSFLFDGGFWLSGYSGEELWFNASTGTRLMNDYIPGKVNSNPEDPSNVVYIARKQDTPFGYYWQQWKNAVNLGAEFYDGDGDGMYNPVDKNRNGTWDKNEDMPMILGDATAWCVYNDGLPSNPKGIEIRQTIFASNNPGLENTMFIRYSIINTGTVNDEMDSVYFGIWKDPDLGTSWNNLVGCDTLLNSDLIYNNENDLYYGENSPSFLTTLLQGPIVNSVHGDTAFNNSGVLLGSSEFPGYKNLDMTAHILFVGGDPYLSEPHNPEEARFYILGMDKYGNYLNPCNFPYGEVRGGINCNEVNPVFWMSGDPVTNAGWIFKLNVELQNLISTGPFKLIRNQPQDVIIAYVLGRGTDPINSITVARENVRKTIREYKSNFASMTYTPPAPTNPVNDYKLYQNYPNPFNPVTRIRYELPQDGFVNIEIYDILGQRVTTVLNKFQKADRYEIEFDGSGLASGIYIYRMKVNDFIFSKKMVLVK